VSSIIKEVIDRYRNTIQRYSRRELTLVVGTMGSGKTTYIKKNLIGGKHLYFSTDDYHEYFQELDPNERYELCREIGIAVTDFLLDEEVSMVLESTGKNEDLIEYISRLKEKGYTVHSIFIQRSLEECINSVIKRNDDPDESHKVDPDSIPPAYEKLWEHGMKDRIIQISDKHSFIDNTYLRL